MSYDAYHFWKTVPNTEEPLLTIVIPAYNEEIRIIPTVGAIASHVSGLGFPWELIVADDGSSDRTVELLQRTGFANMRVLIAEKNGGKGSAVRRGVKAARGQYILFSDADNSTPIEEVDKLLNYLRNDKYDVAIGSRAADGAEVAKKSMFRHLLSNGLHWIVKAFFRIGVKDTQCGFKMYTREAALRLHEAQTIMGFSFDLEILYLAGKFDFSIVEVPVSWVDAPGSKVDTRKEIQRFLRDLLIIKSNDLKGVYANA